MVSIGLLSLVTTSTFGRYIYKNVAEQLLADNEVAYRLALLSDDGQPHQLYNRLSDSTTLVYTMVGTGDDYSLRLRNDQAVYAGVANASAFIDQVKLLIGHEEATVVQYQVKDRTFLATQKSYVARAEGNRASIVVVSIIPLKSVQDLIASSVKVLLILAIAIIILSSLIFLMLSGRLTKPIKTLSVIADEYANREFDNSLNIKTGDEVEELSLSVSKMAASLIDYEKQKTATYRRLSHEIKTPLTAIYGYAEGIKNGIFDNQEDKLDIIMEESVRIKQLLEDILLLSKLESHVESFEMKAYSMNQLIVEAIEKIESIAIMKNLDIVYTPVEDVQVVMDHDKLLRAFINVLSNAIKYTKDEIYVEIQVNAQEVIFCVRDNGPGFDQGTLERIKNQRAKEGEEGSGLGLLIVTEIMRHHHGRVDFIPMKASGTQVNLIIPK